MICKCPKCGSFTTGEVDTLRYAGIVGRQSCKEIQSKGSELAKGLSKWSRDALGKEVGDTVGRVGSGTINAISTALGQGRSLVDSVSALTDYEKYYGFQCKNCGNEWVEDAEKVVDCRDEFYFLRRRELLNGTGRRYLVINPGASNAYSNNSNLFMLPALPEGLQLPNNAAQNGEIYVSHPGEPLRFFTLESYRINLLEDELNDLKVFLQKLGASTITIKGMSDSELERANQRKQTNKTKMGNRVADAEVHAMSQRECEEYRRLRNRFQTVVESEALFSPEVDSRLLNKWVSIRPEWNNIVEHRKAGATRYSFTIETEEITSATKMELDKLDASYKELGIKAENGYTREAISKLKEAHRMSFSIEVTFHSLTVYARLKGTETEESTKQEVSDSPSILTKLSRKIFGK